MKKLIKWEELSKEILGSKDEIQKSYEVKLNGNSGYLNLSNRKLLLLEEKVIISVKYNNTLELSYPYLSKGHVMHKLMVIINRDKNEYNFMKGALT